MITRETVLRIDDYRLQFRVVDDKDWMVTLDNDIEEFGLTSCICTGNWNHGIADVLYRMTELTSIEERDKLMHKLSKNEFIDWKAVACSYIVIHIGIELGKRFPDDSPVESEVLPF